MGQIIYTDGPGKTRHHYRRSIAEMLRRLSQKGQLDDEAKDQVALIVLCLQGIADTVDQTVSAWEKRDYWMKAERFQREWEWVDPAADRLCAAICQGQWQELSVLLAGLAPRFSDIAVRRMTRDEALWNGAYDKLLTG